MSDFGRGIANAKPPVLNPSGFMGTNVEHQGSLPAMGCAYRAAQERRQRKSGIKALQHRLAIGGDVGPLLARSERDAASLTAYRSTYNENHKNVSVPPSMKQHKWRHSVINLCRAAILATAVGSPLFGQHLQLDYVLNPTQFGISPDAFGWSLCASGNLLAVAQPTNWGAVYVFQGSPEIGYQLKVTVPSPDQTYNFPTFGSSLGFRGSVLYVGSSYTWRYYPHDGTAYLYRATNGTLIEKWTESPHTAEYFGIIGGVVNDILYVGQRESDTTYSGLFLYSLSQAGVRTPVWSFVQAHTQIDTVPVVVTRDRVFVHSGSPVVNSTNQSIVVYDVRRDGAQSFVGLATNCVINDTNLFGAWEWRRTMDARSNLLVLGNPYFPCGTNLCGAVFVYAMTSSNAYARTAVLLAPVAQNGALFGAAVRFVGDRLVVGSPGYISSVTNHGCVYTYAFTADGQPTLLERYEPAVRVTGTNEYFGGVVETAGDRVVIGCAKSMGANGVPLSSSIGSAALYFLSFRSPTCALNLINRGGGTVAVDPPTGPYTNGSVVSVVATPTLGWTLLRWLGDLAGNSLSNNLVMDAPKVVEAEFGTSLQTVVVGNGSLSLDPPGGVYPHGTQIRLYATPGAGSCFYFWGNAGSGTYNPLTITVTNAGRTVGAVFWPLDAGRYALAVRPEGSGQVAFTPNLNVYTNGQVVAIYAMPDANQKFTGWSGDAGGLDNPLSVTMNQSRTITANFTRRPLLLVSSNLEGMKPEGFRLTLSGQYGDSFNIYASTNLADWPMLGTVTSSWGRVQFTDRDAGNFPRRFYRAVSAP
jgi:hypothetical protein